MGIERPAVPDHVDPGPRLRPDHRRESVDSAVAAQLDRRARAAAGRRRPAPAPRRARRRCAPPAARRAPPSPAPRSRGSRRPAPAPRPCSAAAAPPRSCGSRGRRRNPGRRAPAARCRRPRRWALRRAVAAGPVVEALGEGRRHQVGLGDGVKVHRVPRGLRVPVAGARRVACGRRDPAPRVASTGSVNDRLTFAGRLTRRPHRPRSSRTPSIIQPSWPRHHRRTRAGAASRPRR